MHPLQLIEMNKRRINLCEEVDPTGGFCPAPKLTLVVGGKPDMGKTQLVYFCRDISVKNILFNIKEKSQFDKEIAKTVT